VGLADPDGPRMRAPAVRPSEPRLASSCGSSDAQQGSPHLGPVGSADPPGLRPRHIRIGAADRTHDPGRPAVQTAQGRPGSTTPSLRDARLAGVELADLDDFALQALDPTETADFLPDLRRTARKAATVTTRTGPPRSGCP